MRVEFGQFDFGFGFPAFLAVLGNDIGENTATHEEFRRQAHETRLERLDQIVKNAVGHGFVEAAFVAERPHVELETLEFDAGFLGNVVQNQRGEVGLAGFRTQAGEFRDFHVDVKIAMRCRIGESFEGFAGLCGHDDVQ